MTSEKKNEAAGYGARCMCTRREDCAHCVARRAAGSTCVDTDGPWGGPALCYWCGDACLETSARCTTCNGEQPGRKASGETVLALKMFTEAQLARERAEAERDALTDRLAAVLVQRDQAVAEAAAQAAEVLDLRAEVLDLRAEVARLRAALDGTLVGDEPGAHDAELIAWHERHEKHASILERMRKAGAI